MDPSDVEFLCRDLHFLPKMTTLDVCCLPNIYDTCGLCGNRQDIIGAPQKLGFSELKVASQFIVWAQPL
jgi:hypothetical protein